MSNTVIKIEDLSKIYSLGEPACRRGRSLVKRTTTIGMINIETFSFQLQAMNDEVLVKVEGASVNCGAVESWSRSVVELLSRGVVELWSC